MNSNEQIPHSHVNEVVAQGKETHALVVIAVIDVVPNGADECSSGNISEAVKYPGSKL